MNFKPALRFVGRLMLMLAGAELVPLACALFYREHDAALAMGVSAGVTAVFGAVLAFGTRKQGDLYRREGILIVVGGWVFASVFGALPYLLSGAISSPVDALFESASGFTTTGASVLTDIEAVDRGILFWRSFTQWLGGMGIIVLFVALMPELGPGARFLYKLEVPGPTAESLQPRIRDTASTLWKIYLALSAAETGLLMVAGMDLYDALTHTFSTMSTGGFSPRNASVAAFDSPAIHLIILIFMILAGANFSLYFGMRLRGGWNLFRDSEFKLYAQILFGATILILWNLLQNNMGTYREDPARALLDSAFQVVSITTTTGFGTADFEMWPALSQILLVALMFVGGCAGSTAGSMKIMRMAVGLKTALREIRSAFSPTAVMSVFVDGKAVPESVTRSVTGFFVLYLSSWAVGAVLLAISGPDLVTAATAAAATIGNIGPGLGAVGPTDNFAFFGSGEKLLMVLLMWLGRLEVYAIAAIFTRTFWKN